MNFFQGLFSEPGGKPSSKRVLNFYVVVVGMTVWAYTSVVSKTVAPFSPEMVALMVGCLGVGAYARGKESSLKSEPPKPA